MNVIFHYGALGDFVLTLPILRRLVGPVTLVSAWERATLAATLLGGDIKVSPMDIQMWEFIRLHAEGGPTSVSPAIGELFSEAQHVISFVSTGKDAWANNVARLAQKAKHIYIDPRPPEGVTEHISKWHLTQSKEQGLKIGEPTEVVATGNPSGPVVVHPGSGGVDKCWPIERYEMLVRGLLERGTSLLPLLGEAEAERWPKDRLDHWVRQKGARVFGTLHELHAALSDASAYIGNDSGPTHLAAQMGLPTVALFGPTDPRVWAPVGPSVTVLAPNRPEAMGWLEVEQVLDACPDQG